LGSTATQIIVFELGMELSNETADKLWRMADQIDKII
jgi:hypothetical protein